MLALSATAYAEEAQIGGQDSSMERMGLGIHGGLAFYFHQTEPFVGLEGRVSRDVTPDFGVTFNPKASYVFLSGMDGESWTVLSYDLNVLGMFNLGNIRPYVGLGINVLYFRESIGSFSDSETEVSPNILIVGNEFDINDSTLFLLDVQMTRFDDYGYSVTETMLRAGINFGI